MIPLERQPHAPPCFNRPERVAGVWMETGRRHAVIRREGIVSLPVVRFRWRWYEDRCTLHDAGGIGPNGETYPEAHGWMPWCRICRWFPGERDV